MEEKVIFAVSAIVDSTFGNRQSVLSECYEGQTVIIKNKPKDDKPYAMVVFAVDDNNLQKVIGYLEDDRAREIFTNAEAPGDDIIGHIKSLAGGTNEHPTIECEVQYSYALFDSNKSTDSDSAYIVRDNSGSDDIKLKKRETVPFIILGVVVAVVFISAIAAAIISINNPKSIDYSTSSSSTDEYESSVSYSYSSSSKSSNSSASKKKNSSTSKKNTSSLNSKPFTPPIKIYSCHTDEPNSVGGVDLYINWSNKSKKTIKYIYFTVKPYNAVGDVVTCDIRDYSSFIGKSTGPYKNGQGEMNDDSYWDCAWYNNTIVKAKITEIEIEYMDGTSTSISNKSEINKCF